MPCMQVEATGRMQNVWQCADFIPLHLPTFDLSVLSFALRSITGLPLLHFAGQSISGGDAP